MLHMREVSQGEDVEGGDGNVTLLSPVFLSRQLVDAQ